MHRAASHRLNQSVVAGHDPLEVLAELECRRQVRGIKRVKRRWLGETSVHVGRGARHYERHDRHGLIDDRAVDAESGRGSQCLGTQGMRGPERVMGDAPHPQRG